MNIRVMRKFWGNKLHFINLLRHIIIKRNHYPFRPFISYDAVCVTRTTRSIELLCCMTHREWEKLYGFWCCQKNKTIRNQLSMMKVFLCRLWYVKIIRLFLSRWKWKFVSATCDANEEDRVSEGKSFIVLPTFHHKHNRFVSLWEIFSLLNCGETNKYGHISKALKGAGAEKASL
jgi:hypothetical protein